MYSQHSRRFCYSFLLLFTLSVGQAQSPDKLEALGTYVEFLNESVHGLTVAHILFVNYNKDLNKYVDIDSHKINAFMTNEEVGVSIFDNPDISTSDNNTSALKLSRTIEEQSVVLESDAAKNFNKLVFEIVGILNNINTLRFKIEKFITSSDLNNKENIYKSYEMLEEAVSLFQSYHTKHNSLVAGLKRSIDYKERPIGYILDDIHAASVSMIVDLRTGNTKLIDTYISRILGALENLELISDKLNNQQKSLLNSIKGQVRGMTAFVTKQEQSPSIPKNYELYGKTYYIHNHLLLSYFNSISPGFVSKMNTLMISLDEDNLLYDDRPIMFKVTYPEKMKEIEEVVASKPKKVDALELPVIAKVEPKQDYIVLEFFDPNLLDRDSISVSFNDEWLLTDYKLEYEPKVIKLEIDPSKSNSIFILARNEGIIAPNTIGFKYRYNGKGKKVYVERELEEGKGYELELTVNGFSGFLDRNSN